MRPVLYYVHHQGLGHWRRALAVTAELTRPVILASSTPPPRDLPAHASYLPLPPDHPAASGGSGHDAGGRLHWAPAHHSGLLRRHQLLLAEASRRAPILAVVDVSVEVAVLLRTSGVPVLAVRLPGERTDAPHELGFALADEIVMPVPPAWGLHDDLARTRSVGLVTAGAGPGTPPPARARPLVLVVVGTGGSRLDVRLCEQIAAELAGHDVRVLGLRSGAAGRRRSGRNLTFAGRVADPRPHLAEASVVIGNAGLGTVSDVAAAGRPFVAVPESRPFDEQHATARALAARGDAVVLNDLPGPGGWAAAVARASAGGPLSLPTDGASRFADAVEQLARTLGADAGPGNLLELTGAEASGPVLRLPGPVDRRATVAR